MHTYTQATLAPSPTTQGAQLYLLGGPTVGLNVDATRRNADGSTTNIDGEMKDVEMGLAVGAGIDMERFLVEGRYLHGQTNLSESASDPVIKHRTLMFLAGLRF